MKQAVRGVIINKNNLLVMHRNKYGQRYYTLPGGGVEANESLETALIRELSEETSLKIGKIRKVFVHVQEAEFGVGHIYWCDYLGGQPKLSPQSGEALSNKSSKNLFKPMWLPVRDLLRVEFLPEELAEALSIALAQGFPDKPLRLENFLKLYGKS